MTSLVVSQPFLIRVCAAALLTLAVPARGLSQAATQQAGPDTAVQVVPGPGYRSFGKQAWLFGLGYRHLWADTIAVPLLDLERVGGGLTPACSPASLLTGDLLFSSGDGPTMLFRSMDKPFAARYLPTSLQRTLAGQIVQDVISADHPAAPVVAPPLYHALGIPYPRSTLVALPDSQSLGDFGKDFGGVPGFLSVELASGLEAAPELQETVEIITTEDLWERTRRGEDVVDALAYLTARLVDVLVGDAGVNHSRLRWSRLSDAVPRVWRPIPWDRDHPFTNNEGLVRWYGRFYVPQLVGFGQEYPSIYGLTRAGSALDRRYLAGLGLPAWDSVVSVIQAAITDSVIDDAVGRMPPEMFQQNGAELASTLKARREALPEAAERYYRLLAEWVDIHASGDGDVVTVTRLSDERLGLSLWRGDAEGHKVDSVPYLERVFRRDETQEIRLYLDGVGDSVAISGEGTQRIRLRIIANRGDDIIHPESNPNTGIYYPEDEPAAAMALIIQPRFGGHLQLSRTPESGPHSCTPPPRRPADDLRAPTRDWGTAWIPIPALGYLSGLGVYAGMGISKTDYAFQAYPFKAQHAIWGGYASTPNSFFAEYYSDFRDVVGPFGGFLGARASGVANPEFYGIGNETTNDQSDSFYQIHQFEGVVTPLATLNPKAYTQIAAGVYYQHSRTPFGTGNIIDALQPFGAGDVDEVGLTSYWKFDSYNDNIATPTGIQLNVTGQLGLVSGDSVFGSLSADVLGFTSTDRLPGHPTLAMRIGAQKNVGAYPFYSAAYLGGTDNLKGYAPNRFAGDGSVYLNTELRLFVTEIRWPIPTNFGILGIADVGRVFVTGESSSVWHTGFGGGIWFGLLRSGQGLNVALVEGESLRLYISTGFILKKKRVF